MKQSCRQLILTGSFLMLSSFLLAQKWTLDNIKVFDKFEELEFIFNYDTDTTYVINFWATWCGPCVKELPYFEALNEHYEEDKVKVILLSLDFRKQIESRLIPFLNKNEIKSSVLLLLDDNANRWIDKVDSKWTGSIPITIVYNKQKRMFFEKSFHNTEELITIIDSIKN